MFRVGCIQPEVFKLRNECYKEIDYLINDFMEEFEYCDLICLPERWVPFSKNYINAVQEERGDDYYFVRDIAKKYNTKIISGAIWENRVDSDKPVITSYLINKDGKELGRQDKIHLYGLESKFFEPGKELIIFSDENISFAILICFDMAFSETPRLAVENGAKILLSPTQIREDGMENWEIYLKARALENRVPVVGCNTFGRFFKRNFIGKSKIISFYDKFMSPSKLSVIEAPESSNGYIYSDIDLKITEKMRKVRFSEIVKKEKISIKNIKI